MVQDQKRRQQKLARKKAKRKTARKLHRGPDAKSGKILPPI
jgi:hypothetical protein